MSIVIYLRKEKRGKSSYATFEGKRISCKSAWLQVAGYTPSKIKQSDKYTELHYTIVRTN